MRAWTWLAIALMGCGDGGTVAPVDAGTDAHVSDAGREPDAGPPDAGPFMPDLECPGSEGCADMGDGVLHVGVAAREITPVIDERTEMLTVDVNGNGFYDSGDEWNDVDGDAEFDGEWIAGYGNGRAATGVSDPQWARVIALRQNETTIVIAALDCVGYFNDQVDRVRARVAALGVDVDYLGVGATHSHESRDTMGIWGRTFVDTGIDPAYMDRIVEEVAMATRDAVAAARRAHVQYASVMLRDQPGGTLRYVSDNRDPRVIDDEVKVMRFLDAADGTTTIATLVNFGSHPEYAGSDNTLLSSDFPHWLREGIEEGLVGPDGTTMVPGVGGTTVFVNAAVGSQIGPTELRSETWDGRVLGDSLSLEVSQTVGTQLAYFVLQALGPGGGSRTEETARIAVRQKRFFVDVQNRVYHVGVIAELFVRESFHWDPDRPLIEGRNEPDIRTEVVVIDIGDVTIVGVPGELDPALFLGGYDGAYTPAELMVADPMRENPVDLSMAPPPPYLRDLAMTSRPDVETVMLFGLFNDEIGYLVPEFDYQLHDRAPYFEQAPGDHYEETNSVGPLGWPTIRANLEPLLQWR
jgi:hypothetical protein